MTRADDAILEFLLNEGNEPLVANPTTVEANIDYKISHVRRRLRALQEGNLVEYYDEDRGLYQITDHGQAYLLGELNSEDLQL
nr:ArsR family transcriptional regulator [Natronococcus sp. CG52]